MRTALYVAFRDRWRESVRRREVLRHSAFLPTRTYVHRRLLLFACWPSMAYTQAPETLPPPSPYRNMEYSPFLLLLCRRYHLRSNFSDAWDEWRGEGRKLLGDELSRDAFMSNVQWIRCILLKVDSVAFRSCGHVRAWRPAEHHSNH